MKSYTDIDEAYKKVAVRFGSNVADEIFFKENEDERIRKAIKKALQVRCDGSRIISDEPVTLEEAIAWLEKQGEKGTNGNEREIPFLAWNEEDENIRKELLNHLKKASYGKTLVVSTLDYKRWADWLEKQGKQKPKKCMYSDDNYTDEERKVLCDGCEEECELRQKPAWSEEDCLQLDAAINIVVNSGHTCTSDWLKSLKNRVQLQPKQELSKEDIVAIDCAVEVLSKDLPSLAASIERLKSLRPQPKQEWSEEDKNMLQSILDEYKSMPTEKRNWLRTLKDRVQPQLKREWSKENEAFYQRLEQIVCKVDIEAFQGDRDLHSWLKSLKDRYTWKPSDEQMSILWDALCTLKHENYKHLEIIKSLYQDLKKLREE